MSTQGLLCPPPKVMGFPTPTIFNQQDTDKQERPQDKILLMEFQVSLLIDAFKHVVLLEPPLSLTI